MNSDNPVGARENHTLSRFGKWSSYKLIGVILRATTCDVLFSELALAGLWRPRAACLCFVVIGLHSFISPLH